MVQGLAQATKISSTPDDQDQRRGIGGHGKTKPEDLVAKVKAIVGDVPGLTTAPAAPNRLDTGSGNIAIYGDPSEVDLGTVKTYPAAGELAAEIRWTPRPAPERSLADGALVLHDETKSFARRTAAPRTSGCRRSVARAKAGPLYAAARRRFMLGSSWSASGASTNVAGSIATTNAFDDFGNVLGVTSTVPEVDLTTTTTSVTIDELAEWLLGQLKELTECSKVAGQTKCRSVARTYYPTTGLLHTDTVDSEGDATMHLAITYGRDAFGNVNDVIADDGTHPPWHRQQSMSPAGYFPRRTRTRRSTPPRQRLIPGLAFQERSQTKTSLRPCGSTMRLAD